MKKLWISVLAAFLLVVLFTSCERAKPYGKLTYSISGGEVTITGCDTSATSVTIPETIDGYPVTSIGGFAFNGCTGLTNITIPDSVTSIGLFAFKDCTNLSSVNISSLDAWCRINFGNSKATPLCYGASLYVNGVEPTEIIFPDGMTSIKDDTFYNLKSLKSITIPDGVTSIGSSAFSGCTGLTSITLPDSVTRIGMSAFKDCINLSSVNISDFNAWCRIDFFGSYDVPLYYGAELYVNGEKPTEVIFPDGITAIKDYTFYNLKSLKSITIPDSVTSIGQHAFEECTSLTSVTIGNGVTNIGDFAFSGCTGLMNIIIPDSVTSIGLMAFYNCTNLTSVTTGNGMTNIDECAFYGCTGLKSITIPRSVTSIGWKAFNSVSSVYIYDLSAWCKISFESIPFRDHSLYLNGVLIEQLILPSGISMISADTFSNTSGIKSVVIPKDVKLISQYAFDGCNSIEEIYYIGTADEWERVCIADHNGSLPTATVYTDYDSGR